MDSMRSVCCARGSVYECKGCSFFSRIPTSSGSMYSKAVGNAEDGKTLAAERPAKACDELVLVVLLHHVNSFGPLDKFRVDRAFGVGCGAGGANIEGRDGPKKPSPQSGREGGFASR